MLKCLHWTVRVEDRSVGEKLKSLHMDYSSKKCGNKGNKAGRQLDCSYGGIWHQILSTYM